MKAATAIMTFMNKGPVSDPDCSYQKCVVSEIKEFKDSMPIKEYYDLAGQACLLLGTELEIPIP